MIARSDEGMWLPDNPPRERLREVYGFDLTDDWLTRARRASIRFTNGGSGGFVSPDGLIVTNHHIGADALQQLSTAERNLLRDGYYARTHTDELRCPEMELNVLISIKDVTTRVTDAVPSGATPEAAAAARRRVMAEIEKESLEATGLRSDVVTLYHGGLYHLYRYKKYTDVRLVFAPEQAIAFFGGDTDNFAFPRYNLDVCFFRAYENDKPAQVEHWFRWSPEGPKEGDLVFVTGHPGTTNRLETLAKLHHRRDQTLPYTLARLRALEMALRQYAETGPEPARQAGTDIHHVANARKAYSGQYQGLLSTEVLARKAGDEQALIEKVGADAKLAQESGGAWKQIAAAQEALRPIERPYFLLERGDAAGLSDLFRFARHLVRLATELPKPGPDRLREYRDSNLDSLRLQLFSSAPVYADLERVKLRTGLTFLAEQLGGDHPQTKLWLAGRSPEQRADELVAGSRLADPAERKRLSKLSAADLARSPDTMIQLALAVDSEARSWRQRYEAEVEEAERQGYAAVARARFALFGQALPPDATFTLRLAMGVVKGYSADGQALPFHTTFGGAFERADTMGHRDPFVLPPRWLEARKSLPLETPFNFVSTADTIGGNSGSPVLNRAGELVGINFDRNRHGLVRNFVYTEEQARHIAVHSQAVLTALKVLYQAEPLLAELTGRR